MAKEKAQKTNAMRILDRAKVPYRVNYYECDEFIDGVHIANQLSQPLDSTFKTLVATGKSGAYYVFVIPVAETLDLKKAAKAVGVKSVAMIKSKELQPLTGYIHGGCSPIGMKKPFKTTIHHTAESYDTIMFSGGRIGCQIEMSLDDLRRVIPVSAADIV